MKWKILFAKFDQPKNSPVKKKKKKNNHTKRTKILALFDPFGSPSPPPCSKLPADSLTKQR